MCPASASVNSDSSPWSWMCAIFYCRWCRSRIAWSFERVHILPAGTVSAQLATSDAPNQPNLRSFHRGEESFFAVCLCELRDFDSFLGHDWWEHCQIAGHAREGTRTLLNCGNDQHVQANPDCDSFNVPEPLRFLFCRKESHEKAARALNTLHQQIEACAFFKTRHTGWASPHTTLEFW